MKTQTQKQTAKCNCPHCGGGDKTKAALGLCNRAYLAWKRKYGSDMSALESGLRF